MPGPAPKQTARAGHRPLTFGEWRNLPPLDEPVLPELPTIDGLVWSFQTKNLWDGWRSDWATQTYGPSEIAMCNQLAFIVEKAVREGKATMWSEVRQWADRLMLTPKGKRDGRVRLEDVPAASLTAITGGRTRQRRGVLKEP